MFSAGAQFPVRSALPPPIDDYDTSFWNFTEAMSSPMNVNNISNTVKAIDFQDETISVEEWYFSYESEVYNENTIRINSVILKRQNIASSTPTILFLHGYGEEYSDYMWMLRELAATGFVIMGIDHPGTGDSTGLHDLSPHTFLNVSTSPQDSNLYHSVWAAVRAITLLETLAYVNDSSIVIAGDSMGAWTTLIVSAMDSRVDGLIPMIVAGNLMNSMQSGSLVNSIIEPSYAYNSEEIERIVQWFDPIAYARLLTQPTLMLFGSNDDFFPIISMKDTVDAIDAPLTLSIVQNWGHAVYDSWSSIITKWMRNQFLEGTPLPSIQVSIEERMTVLGAAISVEANTTNANRAWVCWRSSEPGAVWLLSEMMLITEGATNSYSKNIVPSTIGKVSFFVIMEPDNSILISSATLTGNAGSFLFPVLLVLSGITLVLLIRRGEWRPTVHNLEREYPYLLGMYLLGLGFVLPFVIIRGRATLSVLEIIELFGNSFFLRGWFLPFFVASLCLVLALSSYRHRFQFRVAGLMWTPVLVILIILFIVMSAIFGFFGTLVLLDLGPGGPVFLAGIILMQLLDKTVRDRLERRLERIRETIIEYEERVEEKLDSLV